MIGCEGGPRGVREQRGCLSDIRNDTLSLTRRALCTTYSVESTNAEVRRRRRKTAHRIFAPGGFETFALHPQNDFPTEKQRDLKNV
jgi:hypothetical protein